jgi:hypothetical protein
MNNEREKIWKEAVMALFDVLSRHLPGRTSIKILGIPVEIRTKLFPECR